MVTKLDANNVALAQDVYSAINSALNLPFNNVKFAEFRVSESGYSSYIYVQEIDEDSGVNHRSITFDVNDSVKALESLSETFNFEWRNIRTLSVILDSDEIPAINIEFLPVVIEVKDLSPTPRGKKTID